MISRRVASASFVAIAFLIGSTGCGDVRAPGGDDAGPGGDDPLQQALEQGLGRVCNESLECEDPLFCDFGEPTAGQCTDGCVDSADCQARFGEFSFCIGAERCVLACRGDSDCGPDQMCDSHWCRRRSCDDDSHCWRFTCDTVTHTCREECFSDLDCQPGTTCNLDYNDCF